MDTGLVLIRHSEPCEFDQHPFGTACKVIINETYDIYLQVGEDEDSPQWELLGNYNAQSDPEIIRHQMTTRLNKNMHYD